MVFFISLNRISIIKEKSHRLSHFRIIILSTYSHFSTALELIFSPFSVICSHQTSGFKCLFQAQSLLHFRLGCLGSRGLGPGGQLPRPRGLAQRLPRGKRSVRKPPVWFAGRGRSLGAKYALASGHNQTSAQFQLPLHTPKLLPSQLLSETNESCQENYGGYQTCKKETTELAEWKAILWSRAFPLAKKTSPFLLMPFVLCSSRVCDLKLHLLLSKWWVIELTI